MSMETYLDVPVSWIIIYYLYSKNRLQLIGYN